MALTALVWPSWPQYSSHGLNTALTASVRPSQHQYGPHGLNTTLMASVQPSQPQIQSLWTSYYSFEHSPIGTKPLTSQTLYAATKLTRVNSDEGYYVFAVDSILLVAVDYN
ncbi:hypothetical protein HAX54_010552, partial [Datura stramonium]|nr:hypothetical protein [Datura stramonium]